MYNVLDISRYIINYSNEKDYGISNLKLQKILYFVQAYFLINSKDNQPCFNERIEAWDFGPVVPEAYQEFKQFGGCDIPQITSIIKFDRDNIWNTRRINYIQSNINEEDKFLIKEVVDKFAFYTATDLVTLTHKQDPWKNAYIKNMNEEITIKSIRDYFDE